MLLMATGTYEYQSAFARRHFSAGKAEGEAHAKAANVLTVLEARGIEVPPDTRARITACDDLDQLDAWLRRAVTANSVDALFN